MSVLESKFVVNPMNFILFIWVHSHYTLPTSSNNFSGFNAKFNYSFNKNRNLFLYASCNNQLDQYLFKIIKFLNKIYLSIYLKFKCKNKEKLFFF